MREAMQFEKEHSVEDIDEFRQKRMDEFVYLVAQLQPEWQQWKNKIPEVIRGVAEQLHGPVAGVLEGWAETLDKGMEKRCQQGFPVVGYHDEVFYGTDNIDVHTEKPMPIPEFLDSCTRTICTWLPR